jgi:hypothetical protein
MGAIKHAQRVNNSTLVMVFTLFVDETYKKWMDKLHPLLTLKWRNKYNTILQKSRMKEKHICGQPKWHILLYNIAN